MGLSALPHNDNTKLGPGRRLLPGSQYPGILASCSCFGYPFIDAANFRNDFENKNSTTNGKENGAEGYGMEIKQWFGATNEIQEGRGKGLKLSTNY